LNITQEKKKEVLDELAEKPSEAYEQYSEGTQQEQQ
jgi:hypothetical protein